MPAAQVRGRAGEAEGGVPQGGSGAGPQCQGRTFGCAASRARATSAVQAEPLQAWLMSGQAAAL
jgi:hypothetical protein